MSTIPIFDQLSERNACFTRLARGFMSSIHGMSRWFLYFLRPFWKSSTNPPFEDATFQNPVVKFATPEKEKGPSGGKRVDPQQPGV